MIVYCPEGMSNRGYGEYTTMGHLDIIHYKQFSLGCARAGMMPEKDRDAILAKPDSRDTAADYKWRKLCAKWNISTSAHGESKEQITYQQIRYLENRIQDLEQMLQEAKAQLSDCEKAKKMAAALDVHAKLMSNRRG